jgi:hypothetical protein
MSAAQKGLIQEHQHAAHGLVNASLLATITADKQ